eukprot:CAMPEP_0175124528 /NCGR_PEP_ID=MMETSP0087-20121206/2829_1 /TAXON_ID=136419 /ORGANISM="Unknown Unknown, Strain D1" /LENGTH=428 /DNA_ID=CAMNT_0016406301 /DNA_START=273 /DNA_END=1559 /DNA_ORIENTATION=+
MARSFVQWKSKQQVGYQLPLDTIVAGQSRTRSYSSLITDSAAGATAFSCGLKTTNSIVAMDPNGTKPCLTILEAAKQKGLATGLVSTSRVTHATPAAFSSHVSNRNDEVEIARQQVDAAVVDVLFGGGYCWFIPQTAECSVRTDDLDLTKEITDKGYSLVLNQTDWDRLSTLPAVALLAPSHMPFDIDRQNLTVWQPSLEEMAKKALDLLKSPDRGFFLMIEGSRIDMAAHNNDPVGHLSDILAFQKAVEQAKSFVDAHPDTILVTTADHETGGLTVGVQLDPDVYPEYVWYPSQLDAATHSTEYLGDMTQFFATQNPAPSTAQLITFLTSTVCKSGLGFDATQDEINELLGVATDSLKVRYALSRMISKRAGLGWTTHGHTGVDVNLHVYSGADLNVQRYFGNIENTEVGSLLANFLGVGDSIPSYL